MTKMKDVSARLKRFTKRLASRNCDFRHFRSIDSAEQTVEWAARTPIEMFNKNALRAKIVQGCVDAASCSHFIETGTYHAATTIGAQRFLGLPVWSCEINPRNYIISRLVTHNMPGVRLFKEDSPFFLARVCAQLSHIPHACPFFYLDAHENEHDLDILPLAEELQCIFALDEFVILIDDFRVPQAEGFEARTYAGVVIEINLVKDLFLRNSINRCYFPAYLPDQDTGYPSGYCVCWRSKRLDSMMQNPRFPLTLIRSYAIGDGRYDT
jgi:hypothetical protein